MYKTELELIILEYLMENSYTNINDIRYHLMEVFKLRNEKVLQEDLLYVNSIIWDYISNRILTPGKDVDNLDLPYVHVSNREKLISRFNEDRDF